jgi:hypothetical protein
LSGGEQPSTRNAVFNDERIVTELLARMTCSAWREIDYAPLTILLLQIQLVCKKK